MGDEQRHGFEELERALEHPHADGHCIVSLRPGGPFDRAGLRVGDVVTHVDDRAIDTPRAWAEAMQPPPGGAEEDAPRRRLTVARDPDPVELEVPAGLAGATVCLVKRDQPAWRVLPDTPGEPVLDAFRAPGEWWLRNSLGDEPAGFERFRWRPEGDRLAIDTLFRIGGEAEPGQTWDYRTRSEGLHRLDPPLSLVRTSFWEGPPDAERHVGTVALGEDGRWRGTHRGEAVDFAGPSRGLNTGYHGWAIATTMPLEEGARRTWILTGDGNGRASCRTRFECLGRRRVEGADGAVDAWCFAWRHYGAHPEEFDELVFVDDERRPVRIEWGPNYGHCVSVLTTPEHVLDGLPGHIAVA